MKRLAQEIREYLEVSSILLRKGLEDGEMTIAEAKHIAAEVEKWQGYLDKIESEAA